MTAYKTLMNVTNMEEKYAIPLRHIQQAIEAVQHTIDDNVRRKVSTNRLSKIKVELQDIEKVLRYTYDTQICVRLSNKTHVRKYE